MMDLNFISWGYLYIDLAMHLSFKFLAVKETYPMFHGVLRQIYCKNGQLFNESNQQKQLSMVIMYIKSQ